MCSPYVSSELDHDLRLALSNKICNDLALVVANVHQKLFGSSVLINCPEHTVWGTSNLLYGGVTVHEMEQLNLAAVIELIDQN